MGVEIERRFLASPRVLDQDLGAGHAIVQGYLWAGPDGNARVRVDGQRGLLTCKGPKYGFCRTETEIAIPHAAALDLLSALPAETLIHKTRYSVAVGGLDWAVDVFGGRHQGLIIGEIELLDPAQVFLRPDWAIREVTWDARFGNSSLALSGWIPVAAA